MGADNNLKKRIMKRVYAIWFVKKIAPAIFIYTPFLGFIALRETANEFFITKIVENFVLALNSGFAATMSYMASAVANIPAMPSLIILLSTGALVFVLKGLFISLKRMSLVKTAA